MTELLAAAELEAALAELPDVKHEAADRLRLRLQAPSFVAAVQLVDLVAASAEELNHHPDIDIRWREVTFVLSTHSAGGITELDLELARRILAHAQAIGAHSTG